MKKNIEKSKDSSCCGEGCPTLENVKNKIDDKIKELKAYVEKNPQKTKKVLIGFAIAFLAFILLAISKNKNKNKNQDIDID